MAWPDGSTLDCQSCGDVLKELTPAEAMEVADRPYDFIRYCGPCLPHVQPETGL